jgi:hypothetical protein
MQEKQDVRDPPHCLHRKSGATHVGAGLPAMKPAPTNRATQQHRNTLPNYKNNNDE